MCDLYSWGWLNGKGGDERREGGMERKKEWEREIDEPMKILVCWLVIRTIREWENFIFLLSQSFVLVTQSTEWAKECAQNMMELAFRKSNR